jgi:hypothetical protein
MDYFPALTSPALSSVRTASSAGSRDWAMKNGLYSFHMLMLDGVMGRTTVILILRNGTFLGGGPCFWSTGLKAGLKDARPYHQPIRAYGNDDSSADPERIDEKILPPSVTAWCNELKQLDQASPNYRQDGRPQPASTVSEADGETDQNERQRVLAVLAEVGVRSESSWSQRGEGDGCG